MPEVPYTEDELVALRSVAKAIINKAQAYIIQLIDESRIASKDVPTVTYNVTYELYTSCKEALKSIGYEVQE